jgi:hypothetical protein
MKDKGLNIEWVGSNYLFVLDNRMTRQDLMRISRALALFRPSVLASMMNLTEDDLIFTEKCLQRTLLVRR